MLPAAIIFSLAATQCQLAPLFLVKAFTSAPKKNKNTDSLVFR